MAFYKWLTKEGNCPYTGSTWPVIGEQGTSLTKVAERKDYSVFVGSLACERIPYWSLPAKLYTVEVEGIFQQDGEDYWFEKVTPTECYGALEDGLSRELAWSWLNAIYLEEVIPHAERNFREHNQSNLIGDTVNKLRAFIDGDESDREWLLKRNHIYTIFAMRSATKVGEESWQWATSIPKQTVRRETKLAMATKLKEVLVQ